MPSVLTRSNRDFLRNVLVSSLPSLSHLHEEAYHFGKKLSEKLLPKTTAYHEIWLDKKMVAGNAVKDIEPMYGPYYLPRKVIGSGDTD